MLSSSPQSERRGASRDQRSGMTGSNIAAGSPPRRTTVAVTLPRRRSPSACAGSRLCPPEETARRSLGRSGRVLEFPRWRARRRPVRQVPVGRYLHVDGRHPSWRFDRDLDPGFRHEHQLDRAGDGGVEQRDAGTRCGGIVDEHRDDERVDEHLRRSHCRTAGVEVDPAERWHADGDAARSRVAADGELEWLAVRSDEREGALAGVGGRRVDEGERGGAPRAVAEPRSTGRPAGRSPLVIFCCCLRQGR